jgi:hypothetical protein
MQVQYYVFRRCVEVVFGGNKVAVEDVEELVEIQLRRADVLSNL